MSPDRPFTELDHPDDRRTLAVVERALPRVAPPDDLFDRILAEVRHEAVVVPLRPRARRRWLGPAAAVASVAAAAVVAIAVLAGGGDGLGDPDVRVAITGKDSAVTGTAALYTPAAAGGMVRVSLDDVPAAPSGHHYEVWVLREGSDEMEAVGSFTPTSSRVELELPLPSPGDYAAIDISIEENGGPPAHSGTSLAGGAVS
jgi:anti-sigma-K factor RskA